MLDFCCTLEDVGSDVDECLIWMIADYYSLHRYLTDVAHVDIYWYIGSRLDIAPAELPRLSAPLKGSSIVPWRYHFNTGGYIYSPDL